MCITPEEIRKIVHQELDDKLIHLMETVNASIDSRMQHMESSPKTIEQLNALRAKIDKHDTEEREHWDQIKTLVGDIADIKKTLSESGDAINTVKDLLAGGRLLRGTAQAMVWVGAVVAGLVGFKIWLLDK